MPTTAMVRVALLPPPLSAGSSPSEPAAATRVGAGSVGSTAAGVRVAVACGSAVVWANWVAWALGDASDSGAVASAPVAGVALDSTGSVAAAVPLPGVGVCCAGDEVGLPAAEVFVTRGVWVGVFAAAP